MTAYLFKDLGLPVNHKRVQRLMQRMGIQAIYPQPRMTVTALAHRVYPYLLRDPKVRVVKIGYRNGCESSEC